MCNNAVQLRPPTRRFTSYSHYKITAVAVSYYNLDLKLFVGADRAKY